jgi:6-phosphofructokinase 2
MSRIVTLTINPSIDQSCTIDSMTPDRKLNCRDVRFEPGGGGINVSRAIRELQGESTAIYASGGANGRRLQGLLEAEDIVRQDPIEIENETRINLMVYEDSSGEQFRLGMPGPEVQEAEYNACLDAIGQLDEGTHVVASGSLPPGVPDQFYAQVARAAAKAGCRCIVDSRGKPLKEAAKAGIYLLKPNHREFQSIVGTEIEDEQQQEAEARNLIERGTCEVLVLSLGAGGVLLVTKDLALRVRSPSVPIRSKVGAGDSMVAGIVLGLARDMNVPESAYHGVAAGAAAVMTPGSELCRKADTDRLFNQLLADASEGEV